VQRLTTLCPKPLHPDPPTGHRPGGRTGRRATAAALTLGLLTQIGLLLAAPPGLASPASSADTTARDRGVESWVTDLNTDQRLTPQPVQGWKPGPGPAGSTVVVDPTRSYQTMTGFGASMTDSSAWLLSNKLTDAARRQAMTDLFSPTKGIGLSMLRQPMGSSDFTVTGAYSYDD
jgi:hypothetical protein